MAFRTLAESLQRSNRGPFRRRAPRTQAGAARWAGLLGLVLAPLGAAAQVTPERPAEFMVYQYPDTLLVVRVDLPEAEFSLRTVGPEGARLKWSAVPGRRLGPVYQYIDSHERPRQLMIEVKPSRPVARESIRLEVLQFRPDDPNLPRLSYAYRQYSLGLEVSTADDAGAWMLKAYSLRDAAETFASLGMEEMRLWSEYFAGHLVLHGLGDRLTAAEVAGDIGSAARRAGFPAVELAAAGLEADALFASWEAARPGPTVDEASRRADASLNRFAGLADAAGLVSEQARAVFRQGLILERGGKVEPALERYARAETLLSDTTDADLLASVRDASASLLEQSGSTAGALAVLDRAAEELSAAPQPDAELDRARALHERGRLLNLAYRHREAALALTEALALQRADRAGGNWGPTALELAWSLSALGDFDAAATLLREGIPRTPRAGHEALLARSWGLLANQHRARGEAAEARRAREQQAAAIADGPGRARLAVEAALDALSASPTDTTEAVRQLERAVGAARLEGDRVAGALAALARCSVARPACSDRQARDPVSELADAGVPWAEAEGRRLLAQGLAADGSAEAARRELERLLGDLYATARVLPGVLEPWLSQHFEDLGRAYLRQVAASAAAIDTLVALERLRRLESARYPRSAPTAIDPDRDEALRELLARAETARGDEIAVIGPQAGRELAELRRACTACAEPEWPQREGVQRLLAALAPDEGVLAYDFSGAGVDAVLAGRTAVERFPLAAARELRGGLEAFTRRAAPEVSLGELERLGSWMLAPLGRLPERLYLLASGPVRGLPLDALRVNERYLAQDHQVVLLQGLASLDRRTQPLLDPAGRVFLAGNPRTSPDPFDLDLARSVEMDTLTERFVGPGLHVVQGVALQLDEFEDPRFEEATLIHLGAPGRIDLSVPDRSRLRLAEDIDDPSAWGLSPARARDFGIRAGLVVLSRTGVAGMAGAVQGRVGLVEDLLDAGAGQVVYTLWPTPEAAATRWLQAFYTELERGVPAAEALSRAKRSEIAAGATMNFGAWASFQLFIR